MVRNALNAKLPPSDWWRIGWWIIQDHYSEEYTSQRRPAKAIEGGRLLEKIIGCHSEKAVNDKIVKTSCGIKIPASEALSFSLVYFSLSFCPPFFLSFFLSFLPHFFCPSPPSNFKSRCSMALYLSSFPHPSFLEIPEWIYKIHFGGIQLSSQTTLTLFLSSTLPLFTAVCFSLLWYLQTEHRFPNGRKRET